MAADSKAKRLSLIGLGSPSIRTLPLPNNNISDADRRHLLFLYAGPIAQEPSIGRSPGLGSQAVPLTGAGFAICARCGLRGRRRRMVLEVLTNSVVHEACNDPKHPQMFPKHRDFSDPKPRRDHRPTDEIPEIEEPYP